MSKVKDLEHSIALIGGQLCAVQMLIEAMMVEGMRTKSIDEKKFMILLDQGMDAFHNNKNMTEQETFGAIGALTSAVDMIQRAKNAKILP